MFTRTYGEQIGIAGLNYLALGIGLSGASQIAARQIDRIYRVYKEKNGGVGKPEFRLREFDFTQPHLYIYIANVLQLRF